MAGLRNANGQIVINEAEAQADIKKIQQAIEKLQLSMKTAKPDIDVRQWAGAAADATSNIFKRKDRELESIIDALRWLATFISKTVRRYQEIDREYARRMRGQ